MTEQKKRKQEEKGSNKNKAGDVMHRCDVESFYREIVNQHGDNDDAQKFLSSFLNKSCELK